MLLYEMNNICEIDNNWIIYSKTNALTSASNNTIKIEENKNNINVKGSEIKGIINEYNNIKNQENKDTDNIVEW